MRNSTRRIELRQRIRRIRAQSLRASETSFVFPLTTLGMTLASATGRFPTSVTQSRGSMPHSEGETVLERSSTR